MAGEDTDTDPLQNLDPDYDGAGGGSGFVDPAELMELLEALDERVAGEYIGTDGRGDWAQERECEIARLEQENEELRKMMGIDANSVAASGVRIDIERTESGRYSTFLLSSPRRTGGGHGQQGSGDGWIARSYWDGHGNGGGQYSSPQQQQQGAPLQRAMELQPGMRLGMQGRRPGIFGAGQQRGGLLGGGAGRGMSIGVGPPPSGPTSLWNQPPALAPPISDRSWQAQGGSNLDLSR